MATQTPSPLRLEHALIRIIALSQWLTDHEPSEEHDLGHGLRENWNPKRRWRSTINSVIASQRLAKGGLQARSRANSQAEEEAKAQVKAEAKGNEHVLVDKEDGPRASEEQGFHTAEEESDDGRAPGGWRERDVEQARKGVESL